MFVTRLPYWADCRGYYAQLRDLPWPVWLDSGFPQSGGGRYDILAADPYTTLVQEAGRTAITRADGTVEHSSEGLFGCLRAELGEHSLPVADLPFCGGAVGYLGYDLARDLGMLPPRAGPAAWPTAAIGIYDWALIVDHARQRSYFVRQGRDPRHDVTWQSALRRLLGHVGLPALPEPVIGEVFEAGLGERDYAHGFASIQRYIRDGDCYQVNFAQCFRARVGVDAWHLYQRMRHENPAPYAALLEYPFGQVLSASPEQFLRLSRGQVQTRPIKGTRPRGEGAEQDMALRTELLSSAKDRAENVMIVDLLRNDLGRVCRPGSIVVPRLFEIESFATVHHLVSTVTGQLADGRDALDLVEACFPGGSITGAPKLRAMQIIDELEPVRREVYCGNVFRLGFDGDLDSNITIRTALLRDGELSYWAGGGIVADSECAAEYQESLDKAASFLRLLGSS
ncbi:MAG: aminodeoxychorismate synthase component I [Gammaproteobacteria bacterium]|nr:aminodeoxychorismate synthase component I [Gammaproteobacteria bacterium]